MGESKWEEVGKAIDVLKKYGLIDDDDFVCDCESRPNRSGQNEALWDGTTFEVRPTEDPEPEEGEPAAYNSLYVVDCNGESHRFDGTCEAYMCPNDSTQLDIRDADGRWCAVFRRYQSYCYR